MKRHILFLGIIGITALLLTARADEKVVNIYNWTDYIDPAVLERWVSEVVTALRGTLEERVAARVLAAESVFGSALAERDVTAAARLRDEVAALDREIAERRTAQARAVAADDRRLGAIGAELCRLRADGAPNRPTTPRDGHLNRSCELTDIALTNGGNVTRVNLLPGITGRMGSISVGVFPESLG